MNLIEHVLKTKNTTQKALAAKLDVDVSQISKWKAGKYMASEREEELLEMVGLFGDDFEYALLVKTEINSNEWTGYFHELNAAILNNHDEINDMPEFWASVSILELNNFGVPIPAELCSELDSNHPFKQLIQDLIRIYADIYRWLKINFTDPDPRNRMNLTSSLADMQRNLELDGVIKKAIIETFSQDDDIEGEDEDKLNQCNVNLLKFKEQKIKARIEISKHIEMFCLVRQENQLPPVANYFDFEKLCSGQMGDDTEEYHHDRGRSIKDYYTHAEKTILTKLNWLEHQLIELKEIKS